MKPSSRPNPFLKAEKQNSSLSAQQRRILQEELSVTPQLDPSAMEHAQPNALWMLNWLDPLQRVALSLALQEQGGVSPATLHKTVDTIRTLFDTKLNTLVELINYHDGQRLYQMTQNCRGKTWIVCTIAGEDFLQAHPAPIPVRIAVSDAVYADERSPELLQMLIDMPAGRYMLAFEVLSTDRPSILSNHVVDPLAIGTTAPKSLWNCQWHILEIRMNADLVKVMCRI